MYENSEKKSKKLKRIFFYSNVKNKDLFYIQQFYAIDINILEKMGFEVFPTNKISDFFKFWKYSIGFFYFYKYSFFPALISKFFFKKNYFTGGIDDFSSENKEIFLRQKLFFFLSYLVSDKCIIVSNSDLNNIQRIYKNMLQKKLVFSYHGISIENFICSYSEYEQKEKMFTTVAWQGVKENVIRKGIDKALIIFSELVKTEQFKDYVFYIVGKCGEGSLYLKQLVNELNISEYVFFTDEVTESDKISYLKKSRYYFQLSKYEGFGIAALEALAAKAIVIHSGNGGLKDVVSEDGIIVSSDDTSETIYEKLLNYDTNIISKSQERILSNFTIKKRFEDFQTFF